MATRKQLGWLMRGLIWERSRGLCWYCGVDTAGNPNVMAQANVDHQVPLDLGGTDDAENLVLACRSCNGMKGCKTPDEFRHYVARQYVKVFAECIELAEGMQENWWSWHLFALLSGLRAIRDELLRRGVVFHGEIGEAANDYQI
jgi:hypothetical protein